MSDVSGVPQIEDSMSLWRHNTVTERLLLQVQDEVASINMTIISGDVDEAKYKYLCGRIAGLRVVEDFILMLRSEGKRQERGKD